MTPPRTAFVAAVAWLLAPAGGASEALAETRSDYAPSVAAAIPGSSSDVGSMRLIGRSGQLYSPAADSTWQRDNVGGIAVDVLGVIKGSGKKLIAIGSYSPIFEFDGTVWSARPLANRGAVRLSRGSSTTAFSVGRHVYAFKSGKATKLLSARSTISAIWASSATRIYVATFKGKLARSSGESWVTLTNPLAEDDPIVALYGAPKQSLYGRSKSGVIVRIDNTKATVVAIEGDLAGLDIHTSGLGPKGELLLAGTVGADESRRAVLLEAKSAAIEIRESLWTLAERDRFTVVASDSKGQMLVSSRRGSLRIRAKDGAWVEGTVSGKVPDHANKSFGDATPARSR